MSIARRRRGARRALVLASLMAVAGCDVERSLPPVPAAARADDETRLAERLRAHVLAIPGVAGATVVVHLAVPDPFARVAAAGPARVAAVIATRSGADPRPLHDATVAAARTLAGPDAQLAVDVIPPPTSPALTSVGPFEVTPRARVGLLVTLAAGLTTIAALAGALTWALGRRRRP